MTDPAITQDAARIAALVSSAVASSGRTLMAIAGPPAVGKSTTAEAVVTALSQAGHAAVLVPMDGFHLDNSILDARGLLPRKGAPETFDIAGLTHLVARLRVEDEVMFPVFDRAVDCAIAGRGRVGPEHRVIVVEGNYLLFDAPHWCDLARNWDHSVFLGAPMAELTERLIQRWLNYGLSPETARQRAEANDLPNARRILDARLPADLVLGD
ncbi:MAG: nucleoside triphosphate hydrolase [Pseudomonadota bacterium]